MDSCYAAFVFVSDWDILVESESIADRKVCSIGYTTANFNTGDSIPLSFPAIWAYSPHMRHTDTRLVLDESFEP
jgi:hypothetical protein